LSFADQELETTPQELRALEEAFEFFSRRTDQLKESYLRLRAETARIDLRLEEANAELESKVQQLDEVNKRTSRASSTPSTTPPRICG